MFSRTKIKVLNGIFFSFILVTAAQAQVRTDWLIADCLTQCGVSPSRWYLMLIEGMAAPLCMLNCCKAPGVVGGIKLTDDCKHLSCQTRNDCLREPESAPSGPPNRDDLI